MSDIDLRSFRVGGENGKTSGAAYGSRSEHSDWLQAHRSIYIQSYSYAILDILSMDILIFFREYFGHLQHMLR